MDFGSLQMVTAWRLCRTGAARCQGLVLHGSRGFRLVVIEDRRIVEWTRADNAAALRKHVRSTFKRLRKEGWYPDAPSRMADPETPRESYFFLSDPRAGGGEAPE